MASYEQLSRVAAGEVDGVYEQIRWAFTEAAIDVEQEPDRADLSAWAASTAYTAGDRVIATAGAHAGLWFVATTTGSSGATEPTWPTESGDTVVDNGVTWRTEIPAQRASWAQKWRQGNIDTGLRGYVEMVLENATLQSGIAGTDAAPTWSGSDSDVQFQVNSIVNRIAELP